MDASQNPSNAFYLHPGEKLGAVFVKPQSMKHTLMSKNKYKFVNGGIQEPTHGDDLHENWERFNIMVVSCITLIVGLYIFSYMVIVIVMVIERLWFYMVI